MENDTINFINYSSGHHWSFGSWSCLEALFDQWPIYNEICEKYIICELNNLRTDFKLKQEIYQDECQKAIKAFDDASGATDLKHYEFKEAWAKIYELANIFHDSYFPDSCGSAERRFLDEFFKFLIQTYKNKAEISKNEFLACVDPKILKKIEGKYSEIEACYENSRNMSRPNPIKDDKALLHFCR